MSNFIEEFKKGQRGENMGIPIGEGLSKLSRTINGIQKRMIYVIASAPKVGKSTLTDYGFVIQPFLHAIENNLNIKWIYFSFEIDRVSKEFDISCYFLFHDKGITHVVLDEGVTVDGKSIIPISSAYLRGRITDDNGKSIKVKPSIKEELKEVYENRIIPMFGEYSAQGEKLKDGYIDFIEERDNPTGMFKYLKRYAEKHGKFHVNQFGIGQRITGYTENDSSLYTIVITDHLRKLKLERGWQLKQTIDKFSEYQVELRNWCGFIFVNIIHTNRTLGSGNNIKFYGSALYPSSENIKDTSNLSEDADYVLTMFDPNDDKYQLKEHFDVQIRDKNGDEIYPNMRTIHLVESRHCESPKHFKVEMHGNIKNFKPLNLN